MSPATSAGSGSTGPLDGVGVGVGDAPGLGDGPGEGDGGGPELFASARSSNSIAPPSVGPQTTLRVDATTIRWNSGNDTAVDWR